MTQEEGQETTGEGGGEATPIKPGSPQQIVEQARAEAREKMQQEAAGEEGEGEAPAAAPAEGAETQGAAQAQGTQGGLKTPFKILEGDEERDPEAEALAKVKYKAKGEEKTRRLDEVVRLAQQAEGANQTIEELRDQRERLATDLGEAQETLQGLQRDRDLFMQALRDESGETFKQIQERFKEGLQRQGGRQAPPQQQQEGPPQEHVQAGRNLFQQHIKPHAEQIAQAYGADAEEIAKATLAELQREPPQFMRPDTLGEILNERIPQQLEQLGYERQGEVPYFDVQRLQSERRTGRGAASVITPREERGRENGAGRVQELEQKVQQLQEQLEATGARRQASARDQAPPPAGGGEGSGAPGAGSLEEKVGVLEEADTVHDIQQGLRQLRTGKV